MDIKVVAARAAFGAVMRWLAARDEGDGVAAAERAEADGGVHVVKHYKM